MSNDTYYLPKDTLGQLRPLLDSSSPKKIDNFSLLLNKCALHWQNPNKRGEERVFTVYPERDRRKKEFVVQHDFKSVDLQTIRTRHAQAIVSLYREKVRFFSCTVDWRLIVGLGNESVYETSMTLHHIYGIPYIPGQAVKGLLRSWLISAKFSDNDMGEFDMENAEKRALKNKTFCDMFGCPSEGSFYKEARQGNVYFFDAFPITLNKDSIQPDIMNTHYAPYYSEKKPPADYQNPIPITFLTVQKTSFEFFIGIKPGINDDVTDSQLGTGNMLDIIAESLQAALQDQGIGAKSAVGYGYFKDIADQTDIFRKAIEQERQEIEEAASCQQSEPLSEVDRLCQELTTLKDENRGQTIFQQWDKLEGEDRKKLAAALKSYYQRLEKWSGKLSGKQKTKVSSIKTTLGE